MSVYNMLQIYFNFLNIWNILIVIITALISLSKCSHLCYLGVSFYWLMFLLIMDNISCFSHAAWKFLIVNYTLLSAGYFCILITVPELFSGMLLSDLETV